MTVKVIKRPDPTRATCRNCGCELEYEPGDKERRMTYDYVGPSGYEDFITCPECFNQVQVS